MDNGEKNTYVIPTDPIEFSELMIDILALRQRFGTQYKVHNLSRKEYETGVSKVKIDIQLLRKLEEGNSINTLIFAKYLNYLGLELVIRPISKETDNQ